MLQQPAPAEPNVLPEQAIRDPFILEFLNLKDEYSESDLEDALLSHLMDFTLCWSSVTILLLLAANADYA